MNLAADGEDVVTLHREHEMAGLARAACVAVNANLTSRP